MELWTDAKISRLGPGSIPSLHAEKKTRESSNYTWQQLTWLHGSKRVEPKKMLTKNKKNPEINKKNTKYQSCLISFYWTFFFTFSNFLNSWEKLNYLLFLLLGPVCLSGEMTTMNRGIQARSNPCVLIVVSACGISSASRVVWVEIRASTTALSHDFAEGVVAGG